jgi:CubicO group peptidase (beta-lactamase class C family)
VAAATAFAACLAGIAMANDREVDTIFANYAGAGMPGAAVMVIRDGKPVLTKTYGLARVEDKIAVASQTNFRLASLTKQFTATAVLMLMERERLSLDDTLRSHFAELGEFADSITIRHLLQHTSGLQDYEPLAQVTFPAQVHDSDVLRILSNTDSSYFKPGSHFRYDAP